MYPHAFKALVGAASLCLLSGCASIVGDSQYPVAVSSAPAGASFEIKDHAGHVVHSGNTPSTVTLKSGRGYFRGETYTLTFKKDGFADKVVTLDSSLSGWYWGNILFGGLIGMLIVDPMTGAMYKLPEGTSADLGQPLAQQPAEGDLLVMSVATLPEQTRARLIKLN
ncbi:hypothetical protein JQR85_15370 [Stutzerimonas urumqiensis]|uniref:hypothetical protein n=1 Tax=Stutzerimonas urumqiensis TaxID=638269 RepID=UPI003DA5B77B